MGWYPLCLQHLHEHIRDFIVDRALADDRPFFLAVESGRVVFIVDDIEVLLVRFVNPFRFAFIELFQLFHCSASFAIFASFSMTLRAIDSL